MSLLEVCIGPLSLHGASEDRFWICQLSQKVAKRFYLLVVILKGTCSASRNIQAKLQLNTSFSLNPPSVVSNITCDIAVLPYLILELAVLS